MQGFPLSGAVLKKHNEKMEGTSYYQRALAILQVQLRVLGLELL